MASIPITAMKNTNDEKKNIRIPVETPVSTTSIKSNTSVSSSTPAVTAHRKQELLLEARRARVEWVDSSSDPFRSNKHLENDDNTPLFYSSPLASATNIVETQAFDEGKDLIQSTYAGQSIPSASPPMVENWLREVGTRW